MELPYDPATPLLGIYPDKTFLEKDTCAPMFNAALFTIAKVWKQPKCPMTDDWIKKMWYIHIPHTHTHTHTHTQNGILLRHQKEQNNAICINKDGSRDSHTK